MAEQLTKLRPDRDMQCYFERPSAVAALSGTSASGFTVSGCWRQQSDWAVIEWNRDNVFEHPALRNLPDGDLSGITLSYQDPDRPSASQELRKDVVVGELPIGRLRIGTDLHLSIRIERLVWGVQIKKDHISPRSCASHDFAAYGQARLGHGQGLAEDPTQSPAAWLMRLASPICR